MWLGLWHHTALYLDTDVAGGPAASNSRGNERTYSSKRAVPTHETARCSNWHHHNMKYSGAQISGAWSSGRLNFVTWRLMFVGSSVSYLNYCTLLVPIIILKWLLYFLENLRALAENHLCETTQKITVVNYGVVLRILCVDEVRNGEKKTKCSSVIWGCRNMC
jgi:hypothetical protein